jgi:hypothetical protein
MEPVLFIDGFFLTLSLRLACRGINFKTEI